jgi:hypothetical protein
MLDDIAEGMVKTIFKGVLRFLFELIVEFFFFYTGEIVLFILAFGKKKPRWNYYADESPSKWAILTELSTWLGIAFWLLIAWLINRVFIS